MEVRELLASYTRKDFRVDTFASGGPGGQHQNKTQSGVRITHIETGISAECREHRSQGQNKREALRKLSERIKLYWRERVAVEHQRNTETVRTYHEPDNRVVDHRTGERETYDRVLRGDAVDRLITRE